MRLLWVCAEGTAPGDDEKRALENLGKFSIETVSGPVAALDELKDSGFDCILADLPLGEWTPEEWLEEVQRVRSFVPVVLRDRRGSMDDAVRLTKLGAYHFFGEGATVAALARVLEEAVEYKRTRELALFGQALNEPWKGLLVGESRPMQDIAHIIRLVGPRRSTVLITGETGTGKEMVARAIHMASSRAHLPMVAVNCSALPEALLEAELFGHVKGAFTGAVNHRIGRFEQAHRSTLFLDEIGDMALDLQAKLLRVLQEREMQRLGSSETVRLDVRVIAATNADLAERIRENRFREDLYYRLNVVPIRLPPLRERLEDVPLLVHHFIEKICRQEDIPSKRISQEALDRLRSYHWPGNVRELENAVEMAIALSGDRRELHPGDFPLPSSALRKPVCVATTPSIRIPKEGLDFERTVSDFERAILDQALQRTGGNKKLAAEMLRLKRTTFSAKLKSLAKVSA
ncbi:MAG TPA: sigma-54 dependent transcriptional regulator [Bryobacteraceae bacterium]|nr:sigma-54 dependent transcriptional regulator [Bryobacteraceae bacterium]HPQ15042.1 sigma-54 dependent transcriptional regulator [Bryobacteraceae bacterium]